MRCLSTLIIAACLASLGCDDTPRAEADLGPPVENERWRLEVRGQGATIHVTLTNVSNTPLRAYPLEEDASLHVISRPQLPMPIVQAVYSPEIELVAPGESIETDVSLIGWIEMDSAESDSYVCRLHYSDGGANILLRQLKENKESQVGEVTSNDFGFRISNGQIREMWHEDIAPRGVNVRE